MFAFILLVLPNALMNIYRLFFRNRENEQNLEDFLPPKSNVDELILSKAGKESSQPNEPEVAQHEENLGGPLLPRRVSENYVDAISIADNVSSEPDEPKVIKIQESELSLHKQQANSSIQCEALEKRTDPCIIEYDEDEMNIDNYEDCDEKDAPKTNCSINDKEAEIINQVENLLTDHQSMTIVDVDLSYKDNEIEVSTGFSLYQQKNGVDNTDELKATTTELEEEEDVEEDEKEKQRKRKTVIAYCVHKKLSRTRDKQRSFCEELLNDEIWEVNRIFERCGKFGMPVFESLLYFFTNRTCKDFLQRVNDCLKKVGFRGNLVREEEIHLFQQIKNPLNEKFECFKTERKKRLKIYDKIRDNLGSEYFFVACYLLHYNKVQYIEMEDVENAKYKISKLLREWDDATYINKTWYFFKSILKFLNKEILIQEIEQDEFGVTSEGFAKQTQSEREERCMDILILAANSKICLVYLLCTYLGTDKMDKVGQLLVNTLKKNGKIVEKWPSLHEGNATQLYTNKSMSSFKKSINITELEFPLLGDIIKSFHFMVAGKNTNPTNSNLFDIELHNYVDFICKDLYYASRYISTAPNTNTYDIYPVTFGTTFEEILATSKKAISYVINELEKQKIVSEEEIKNLESNVLTMQRHQHKVNVRELLDSYESVASQNEFKECYTLSFKLSSFKKKLDQFAWLKHDDVLSKRQIAQALTNILNEHVRKSSSFPTLEFCVVNPGETFDIKYQFRIGLSLPVKYKVKTPEDNDNLCNIIRKKFENFYNKKVENVSIEKESTDITFEIIERNTNLAVEEVNRDILIYAVDFCKEISAIIDDHIIQTKDGTFVEKVMTYEDCSIFLDVQIEASTNKCINSGRNSLERSVDNLCEGVIWRSKKVKDEQDNEDYVFLDTDQYEDFVEATSNYSVKSAWLCKPPQNLTCYYNSRTSCTLFWDDNPYDFIVKKKKMDAEQWQFISEPMKQSFSTFKVIEGERYIFEVTTVTDLSESETAVYHWMHEDEITEMKINKEEDKKPIKGTPRMHLDSTSEEKIDYNNIELDKDQIKFLNNKNLKKIIIGRARCGKTLLALHYFKNVVENATKSTTIFYIQWEERIPNSVHHFLSNVQCPKEVDAFIKTKKVLMDELNCSKLTSYQFVISSLLKRHPKSHHFHIIIDDCDPDRITDEEADSLKELFNNMKESLVIFTIKSFKHWRSLGSLPMVEPSYKRTGMTLFDFNRKKRTASMILDFLKRKKADKFDTF